METIHGLEVSDQICIACPSAQNKKCVLCKKFICDNCLVNANNKVYCVKCYKQTIGE